MRMTKVVLAAAAALSLSSASAFAGAHSSGEAAAADPAGSGSCTYTYSMMMMSEPAKICKTPMTADNCAALAEETDMMGGEYVDISHSEDDACPTEGAFGSCTMENGAVDTYYGGVASEASMGCSFQGEWTDIE